VEEGEKTLPTTLQVSVAHALHTTFHSLTLLTHIYLLQDARWAAHTARRGRARFAHTHACGREKELAGYATYGSYRRNLKKKERSIPRGMNKLNLKRGTDWRKWQFLEERRDVAKIAEKWEEAFCAEKCGEDTMLS